MKINEGNSMNMPAKSSNQVQRARQKIKKELENQKSKIQPETLEKMRNLNRHWLSRHGNERIKLKQTVTLFDQNTHPAKTKSEYVHQLRKRFQDAVAHETSTASLRGRVSAD